MNDERRRILNLVATGKITAEEASDLLDALQNEGRGDRPFPHASEFPHASQFSQAPPFPPAPPWSPTGKRPGALIIQIREGENSRVNLRIPLGLARAAGKFIPRKAQQQLGEHGVDLAELLGDLSGTEQGTLLQVDDDDDHVLIAVE